MLNWAKWIEVESTNIEKFRYNREKKTLFVMFKKREDSKKREEDIYCYRNVPTRVFNQLIKATSVGKFINTKVKPRYDVDKVEAKTNRTKKLLAA